ncbi:hypothetical protein [Croceicoccus marinus]|uniref:DUF998 domain-containing protein n=1 Tax=Croceicoccus marinus TaxID=450378 RepID=A0A1Z1FCC7_9SPHN|nr:hypothetical protein [Croceicoccus marinus]ARU16471.1 hypothetical protein A9D14_10105 [Croceicoccus marinus]
MPELLAKYGPLLRRNWTMPTRRDFAPMAAALGFSAAMLILLAAAMAITGLEGRIFTGEPQDVLKGAFYVGAFSNLGGVVWFSCAAILSFTLAFRPRHGAVLGAAALLSWAMGIDDVFLLHDHVYPHLMIPQKLVMLGYFALASGILLTSVIELPLRTSIGIAATIGFWAVSGILDLFFNHLDQSIEDGAKFIGIAIWAATWIAQAHDILRDRPAAPPAS